MRSAPGQLLHILYCLKSYQQPSQTFVELEIDQLRRLGHRVDVLAVDVGTMDRHADPRVTYLRELPAASTPSQARFLLRHPWRVRQARDQLHRLQPDLGGGSGRVSPAQLLTAAEGARRRDYDVIHAHFAWSGATAALGLGRLLRRPVTMTVHANDIYARTSCLREKLSDVDALVTVCEFNRRFLRDRHPCTPAVHVITCGVELPEPGSLAARDSGADVVCVGRLVPKKGIDVLVRAAAVLKRSGWRLDVQLIGSGPEQAALEALVRALDVEDSVHFAGARDHASTLAAVSAAKVACLPCRVDERGDHDAMPTIIIEAMARGVPVVSTRVGGIPEMVDEGCGALVPPDDPEALAAALQDLLRDPQRRRRLGEQGAVRASSDYDVRRQTGRLAALWQQLLVEGR